MKTAKDWKDFEVLETGMGEKKNAGEMFACCVPILRLFGVRSYLKKMLMHSIFVRPVVAEVGKFLLNFPKSGLYPGKILNF